VRQESIFFPAIALVGLTFVIWVLLYQRRVGAMRKHRVNPERLKTRASRVPLDEQASAADNFQNLLELPLLFYTLVLAVYATRRVDLLYLVLAWGFVALRMVHSVVHVSYNRVMHRFTAYFLGGVLLWAAWLRFTWSLLRG
jgi:hypothetical protein